MERFSASRVRWLNLVAIVVFIFVCIHVRLTQTWCKLMIWEHTRPKVFSDQLSEKKFIRCFLLTEASIYNTIGVFTSKYTTVKRECVRVNTSIQETQQMIQKVLYPTPWTHSWSAQACPSWRTLWLGVPRGAQTLRSCAWERRGRGGAPRASSSCACRATPDGNRPRNHRLSVPVEDVLALWFMYSVVIAEYSFILSIHVRFLFIFFIAVVNKI